MTENSNQNNDVAFWQNSIEFNRIFERPGLEQIVILGNNNYYKTEDGILYSKDGRTLIKCPMGRTGNVVIQPGTEIIKNFAFKKTGLVADNVLDMLSIMIQNDSNTYDDISLSDNDKTIITAYIMEAKEKIRNQKEETLNKFSLPD